MYVSTSYTIHEFGGGGVPQRPKAPIPAGRLATEDLNLRLRVSSMSANYAYLLSAYYDT